MTIKVAPGFIDLMELYPDTRLIDLGEPINDAVVISAQLHTEQMNELLGSICEEPPRVKENVEIGARTELQPIEGEFDKPKPVGSLYKYQAGYPLFKGAHAWGTGRESRVKMTVRQANTFTLQGLQADANWIIRHILNAWFYNASWTFKDKEWGDLPCVPLANADTQEYVLQDGSTATDDHFLAQAAAIDGTHNPFPTIYTELTEHPENSGDPIVYVPTALKASIEALTGFVPNVNPAILPGATSDRLSYLPELPFGDRVLGMVDDCWIVEWRRLPATHMVAHMSEVVPFMGWRQDDAAELRGLFTEFYTENGVQQVSAMLRYSGFSVRRRTGALVFYVGGASYAPPTGYTTPVRAQ